MRKRKWPVELRVRATSMVWVVGGSGSGVIGYQGAVVVRSSCVLLA